MDTKRRKSQFWEWCKGRGWKGEFSLHILITFELTIVHALMILNVDFILLVQTCYVTKMT